MAAEADVVRDVHCPGTTLPAFQQFFPMRDVVQTVLETAASMGAQVILLPNNLFYPHSHLYSALLEAGCRLPVVAAQHGLVQAWASHRNWATCDWFFAFGPRYLEPARHLAFRGAVAAGLPKLDRLAGFAPEAAEEIVVLGNPSARGDKALQGIIDALPDLSGLPLYVRGHPMYPALQGVAHRPADLQAARRVTEAPIPRLFTHTALALGSHSTALLEAMWAGVPVVVLPLHQWQPSYENYPGLAEMAMAGSVMRAWDIVRAPSFSCSAFLADVVTGQPGGQARRFAALLSAVGSNPDADPASAVPL
jgi:hypothetical protein